jgi:outer membrane receptor protein involved in Fe transport
MNGCALTGAVHAESSRAATNTNVSFAPAYATFDLGVRVSKTFNKKTATLRFQVFNVGNTFYYSSIADGNIAVARAPIRPISERREHTWPVCNWVYTPMLDAQDGFAGWWI